MTARAGDLTRLWRRLLAAQQLGQCRRSGLVQCRAKDHLQRLQISSAAGCALGKDVVQQAVYFPRDLSMDRGSRFFSSAVQRAGVFSTGRRRQILSLTAVRSALNSRNRRNSAISASAFCKAAAEEIVSATVLPPAL